MDHKRISKLLKKISNLNDSISEDPEFSGLERQHIISYIEKLHSEVKGDETLVVEEDLSAPIVIEEEPIEVVVEDEVPEAIEEIEEIVPEVPEYDEELLELFKDASTGNELSDKLSQRPLKDLTKAMSINERIFTIKELFGNDKDEYQNMMTALNGLNSFEEAKQILLGSVATKYKWGSKSKMKKAIGFIKTVRRRYL